MKKLNRSTLLSLAGFLLLIAAPSAWAAERMKSGQWEMTTMDGSRSRTATHCVTPEELKAANGTPAELRAYIEQGTKAANCTVQNFKIEGNTVSYTSACKGTSTDSTTTYHGDSFEMTMASKSAARSTTRQVKARRLGACP
jgi:hypothetical protein